ncbi:MAG: CDP-alcohol phosphatidyltransferase family protein [Oscillospiraceae bacterium]|jgi:CDP-diacylglycerol--glycerol-3-phosphate 3-phosphatidyltransferase|nr:CDP-alcohol phosphatidyltransferase family protein [Oscillospiraceae bacterium]
MIKILAISTLTLSRVPLSLAFCSALFFQHDPFFPCAALFLLIGMTDLLDGRLARKYKAQTRTGAVLDVLCDFFFIATASSALCAQGLLPGWMLAVILLKFLEFLISSAFFRRRKRSASRFLFDPLGRAAAVFFYLLPILVLLLYILVPAAWFPIALGAICAGIAALALVSSLLRIFSKAYFSRQGK